MSKNIIWGIILAATSLTAHAVVVEWDKITHWSGEGSNRAALVCAIQRQRSAACIRMGIQMER